MPESYLTPEQLTRRIRELALKSERELLDPQLQLTFDARATDKALELFTTQGFKSPRPQMRVYIEGKGCDGFFYGVAFDQPTSRDFICKTDALDIIIDPDSLIFLHGSNVTWIQVDGAEGFFVENPNHERFKGKFYKKSAWKKTFTDHPLETKPGQ